MSRAADIRDDVLAKFLAVLPAGSASHKGWIPPDRLTTLPVVMAYSGTWQRDPFDVAQQVDEAISWRFAVYDDAPLQDETAQDRMLGWLDEVQDAILTDPTLGDVTEFAVPRAGGVEPVPERNATNVGFLDVVSEDTL
jgi:hypothetical protein